MGGGVAGFLWVLVLVGWFVCGGGVEGEGAVVVGEAEVV